MIKVKWIKVGDVIEVDGKKAKLKSIGEDFRYATLYTFKREDGSKFHWGHREVYEYVMDRHIRKLENLLNDEKQRADELENQWNKLRDRLVRIYKNDTETGKQYLRSFLCLLDELEGKENVFETVQNLKD